MYVNQMKAMEMPVNKRMSFPHQAIGQNGHYPSSGPLSWYLAQCPKPAMTYALTVNGYVRL